MNESDWLRDFKFIGSVTEGDQYITSYEKVFPNEYRIIYQTFENLWGGKSIITVEILPVIQIVDEFYHLRAPTIQFFATGFDQFDQLELLIKNEVVPQLKKWTIKVL